MIIMIKFIIVVAGKPSRAKRGGGSSSFKWKEKSCGLPDMQVILIMIIMIIIIMITITVTNIDTFKWKEKSCGLSDMQVILIMIILVQVQYPLKHMPYDHCRMTIMIFILIVHIITNYSCTYTIFFEIGSPATSTQWLATSKHTSWNTDLKSLS